MNVKEIDKLLVKQMNALEKKINKQDQLILSLSELENRYRDDFDALKIKANTEISELIEAFKTDHNISLSMVDEIEDLSNRAEDFLAQMDLANKQANEYINKVDGKLDLFLSRLEDANRNKVEHLHLSLDAVEKDISDNKDVLSRMLDNSIDQIKTEVLDQRVIIQSLTDEYIDHKNNMTGLIETIEHKHNERTEELLVKVSSDEEAIHNLSEALEQSKKSNEAELKKLKVYMLLSTLLLAAAIILMKWVI